jgi:hypothetical protein
MRQLKIRLKGLKGHHNTIFPFSLSYPTNGTYRRVQELWGLLLQLQLPLKEQRANQSK